MIAGSSRSLQTNKEWKALPTLGPYYGKDWYIKREGEGTFDPVINRTPAQAAGVHVSPVAMRKYKQTWILAQAAAARLMPKPPNLETYAAALTRDKMDETIDMVYGPFMPKDIDRGDWIEAIIRDHKLAKHTANALLMYPSLERHCTRCTEIHDPRHRNFSKERCIVLSGREQQDMGGLLPGLYIYCASQPMQARSYCPSVCVIVYSLEKMVWLYRIIIFLVFTALSNPID
jgi:hypothetical protein